MAKAAAIRARGRCIRRPYALGYKTSVAGAPRQPLLSLESTVPEKTGPRFGHGGVGPFDVDLILIYAQCDEPISGRIVVHSRVLDENCRGVPHTLVEIGQANAGGATATATTLPERRRGRLRLPHYQARRYRSPGIPSLISYGLRLIDSRSRRILRGKQVW